jgi:hypothetical protein
MSVIDFRKRVAELEKRRRALADPLMAANEDAMSKLTDEQLESMLEELKNPEVDYPGPWVRWFDEEFLVNA